MGGGAWSNDAYADRQNYRSSTNTSAFVHDAAIKSGAAAPAAHPTMDPSLAKLDASGKKMRESRDSDDHPESLAIATFFDVTGSMGLIPEVLQKKLGSLMQLLITKGYVPHPQILFGGIGDANCDKAPLQVGQFESTLAMDDDLGKIWREGGGGGQNRETYELAHYFTARHTSIDCWEKRGVKGYFFTMGDEGFYDTIKRNQVKELVGDDLEADLSTIAIVRELEERYNVFHIIVNTSTSANDARIHEMWTKLLGERCLKLDDPDNIAELIAMTIGLNEGSVDSVDSGVKDLVSVGASHATAQDVGRALATYAKTAISRSGSASGLADTPSGAGVTRL